jgi:predicted nucleic-acid-binding Zn-ribbon protein
MMSQVKTCPKCGGTMRIGKLLARDNPIRHYDLVFEGGGQNKLLPEKKWVTAFAYENCGYLENYLSKTGYVP